VRSAIEQSLCGDEWTLTAEDGRAWPARVPGCAHTDLMRHAVISPPDSVGGEESQEWVGRSRMSWTRSFRALPELLDHDRIDLVFERLDTAARVSIDGVELLECANEFHPHRIAVGERLRAARGEPLALTIACEGPVAEVLRLERALGPRPVNGEWTPYPFLRKTACEFGWDWGPRVPSSGIRGLVYLHAWSRARIASMRPLVTACSEHAARLEVRVDLHSTIDCAQTEVRCRCISPDGRVFDGRARASTAMEQGADAAATITVALDIDRPMRWWPRGHGGQPLYRVEVALAAIGEVVDRASCEVGLRMVALDTSPDEIGSRFQLLVNDCPIWCAGANWIPDGLLDQCSNRERITQRLHQACDANFNMLRVWGGGGYECDAFYEECDRLGLLVWQDFAFACATYPEDAPFPARIEAEARWQVARLARHPSVALWCGGNEDILAWASWGFAQRLAPSQSWGKRYWLELLPRVVGELDPTRPYWTESPWSGSLDLHPNDPSRGDRHTWDAEAKVEGLRTITPRFCSEFGHQSPPNLRTMSEALGVDELELAALPVEQGVALMASRQRATGGDEPQYGRFLSERFPVPHDFGEWVAQAQLVQARAMRIAYTWLRSNRPRCTGALVWQLNDAWTGHSWSLIDVIGRPKPAWHAVREACAPRMLALHPHDGSMSIEAVNDTDDSWRAIVRVDAWVGQDDDAGRTIAVEPFEVAPRGACRVCCVAADAWGESGGVLFAEASTGISEMPVARVWHASTGSIDKAVDHQAGATPRRGSSAPRCRWCEPPTASGDGSWHALVEVVAATSVAECLFVPLGPWISCEPMLLGLAPGETATVRVRWRSSPGDRPTLGVDAFVDGCRAARLV